MIFPGRNQIPYGYGRYGWTRANGKTWHGGQDIVGLDNTTVRALAGGKILRSRMVTDKRNRTWEWGNYVTVQVASGEQHIYAHLESRLVQAGETVKAGQALGVMGNTGNAAGGYKHVHFERRAANGKTALDPSAVSGCANRVGTYGRMPVAPLSPEAVVINVGPASAGDVRAMQALAASLQVGCKEAGGMLAMGPMTPGDQVTILTKAAELSLPASIAAQRMRIEIDTPSLRVRTGPGTDEYKQVGSVKEGEQYDALDKCGNWYFIETDALDGWVCGDFVKLVGAKEG